jgi:hypothetical protein
MEFPVDVRGEDCYLSLAQCGSFAVKKGLFLATIANILARL